MANKETPGSEWSEADRVAQPEFARGVELYQKGVKGNREAVQEAYRLFGELRIKSPENNLVNAYYGSAVALMGRDATDPMKRFEKVVRGLKYLDRAVEKEPENIRIRILRASICANLPEMYFHRTATAIEDFNDLITRYEQDPSVLPVASYYQYLYDLGVAYQHIDQEDAAEAAWERLRKKTKGTQYDGFFFLTGADGGVQPIISDSPVTPLSRILTEGKRLHQEALTGNPAGIQTAVDFFAKAMALIPENPLLRAYHTDCLSLMGRYSQDSTQMFSGAIKAIKQFDAIVNQEPDNILIRLIRADHSLRLPEGFFHRTCAAIADYETIAKRYDADRSILTDDQYSQLLYNLGAAYRRLGLNSESEQVWKKLLAGSGGLRFKDAIDEQCQTNSAPRLSKSLSLDLDKEAYYQESARLHDLGVAGSKEAAELALDLWEKAYQKDTQDPLATAYYGSSLALTGKYATDINTVFGNAIKGLKLVNQAVTMDEANVRIRLLRAFLSYSLPEGFFHQTQKAIKDFQFLKQVYEQDSTVFAQDVYLRILQCLEESGSRIGSNDARTDPVDFDGDGG